MLNDLYITDLCIWIQKTKKKKILSICNKLQCMKVGKDDLDLGITNVERSITEWVDKSSGDEEDSSSDSSSSSEDDDDDDDAITTSEEDSDSEEEDSSSNCSTEVVSSLDSDDFEEAATTTTSTTAITSTTKDEKIPAGSGCSGIEVIRTGLEELLQTQKLVDAIEVVQDENKNLS